MTTPPDAPADPSHTPAGIPADLLAHARAAKGFMPDEEGLLLHRVARHYRDGTPFGQQIEEASARWSPEQTAVVHARLTSVPGGSARLLRQVVYRLMDLPEPEGPARLEPLRSPEFVGGHSPRALWAEGRAA